MYDYVDFEMDCPTCSAKVKGFRSKDGPCYMEKLKPWEVSRFYTNCGACGSWIEFSRGCSPDHYSPPEPVGWRDEFKMSVEKKS